MRVHIDITDLLEFLIGSDILHGVQNVTYLLIQEARRRPEPAHLIGFHPVYGTPFTLDLARLTAEDLDDVRRFKALFAVGRGARPVKSPAAIRHRHPGRPMRQALEHGKRWLRRASRRGGRPGAPVRMLPATEALEIAPGDLVLMPGLNVWYPEFNRGLGRHIRARGGRLALVVHDLGPLTAAEFFPESYRTAFAEWADSLFPHVDLFITDSDYTRRELERLLGAERGGRKLVVNPLAHEFPALEGPPARPEVAAVAATDFVLYVGRIEPRKNVTGLVRVWGRLAGELGERLPLLVLAGRMNFAGDEFERAMAEIGPAAGRIRFVKDLTTVELATLYRACRFAVYPSFFEGWGLPVGEAAAFCKVTAAADAASIPEVVGDLAVYFDPHDPDDMASVLAGLITDPDRVAALEARIAGEFRPRSWPECARALLATAEEAAIVPAPLRT